MPVIQISTFRMADQKKAEELLREITATMHRVTNVPLDKISVFLTEVEPSRWADAGVVGSDPEFPVKSRRKSFGESS